MNRKTILTLSGRELDAAVGQSVMGLNVRDVTDEWKSWSPLFVLAQADGSLLLGQHPEDTPEDCRMRQTPKYSTDANACRLMEAEIERRGLATPYLCVLLMLLGFINVTGMTSWFLVNDLEPLLTSPLDQKCRAALLAVMETEETPHAE